MQKRMHPSSPYTFRSCLCADSAYDPNFGVTEFLLSSAAAQGVRGSRVTSEDPISPVDSVGAACTMEVITTLTIAETSITRSLFIHSSASKGLRLCSSVQSLRKQVISCKRVRKSGLQLPSKYYFSVLQACPKLHCSSTPSSERCATKA